MAGRKTTNKEKIEKAKKELETLSAILGKILDDTMTQTEAARKLGITPQEFRNETIGNFTNYVKKKNILTEDDILAYLKDMETPLDRVAKDMFNITDNSFKSEQTVDHRDRGSRRFYTCHERNPYGKTILCDVFAVWF